VAKPVAASTRIVPLTEAVDLNPRPDRAALPDDLEVSFVPMAAVEAATGRVDSTAVRRFGEVKKGYTVFREGDVLFAKITPCMENGKMAVARGLRNGVGCGSTEFHVLRPRPGVDPHYVYHFVSSARFRAEAAHHMTGAVGQKRVPAAFLGQCEIPLPDLDEQRRLVAEIEKQLSRLDEAVANLKRAKANLRRYVAAMLRAAFTGQLVPKEAELARQHGGSFEPGCELLARLKPTRDSRKPKAVELPPTSFGGPEIEGWAWTTLGECFKVSVGATPSRKEPAYWGGSVPWVSSGEVQFARISRTKESITETGLANSSTQINPAGSVLLGMIGQGRTRGQAAILDIAAANNQNCAAIWVTRTPVPPEFVYYWLVSRYEQTRGEGSGNNQQALNKSLVEAIPLPLPPLVEQHRIVTEVERRLSLVRGVEAQVSANLARAHVSRRAMLTRSFGGEARTESLRESVSM
jgi:type I restriction enzyme S subunit